MTNCLIATKWEIIYLAQALIIQGPSIISRHRGTVDPSMTDSIVTTQEGLDYENGNLLVFLLLWPSPILQGELSLEHTNLSLMSVSKWFSQKQLPPKATVASLC